MLVQSFQIDHNRLCLDSAFLQVHQQITPTAVGLTNEIGDGVQALPIELVSQNGRLAPRRPGTAQARLEREAALIMEDQGGRSL